jgi:hypothetical protein
MELDTQAFMRESFTPRQEAVVVEALRPWFKDLPEKESPTWTVRGVTAAELAIAHEAATRQKNVGAAIEAVATAVGNKDKVASIQDVLGIKPQETPADTAKRLELLTMGSVDPQIDLTLAVRLAENFPIEFMLLTNTITKLTGMGAEVGKPKPSGKTRKSAQQ